MLLLGSMSLPAQVVLEHDDFPMPGQIWVNASDTMVSTVDVGMPGANQSWTFTGLDTNLVETLFFVEPDTTPWVAAFPDADIALGFPGIGYSYLSLTDSAAATLGIAGIDPSGLFGEEFVVAYEDPETVAVFPAQMGTAFTDTSAYQITIVGNGIDFDSARIKTVRLRTVTYDAWGTLTTPAGTVEALRSQVLTVERDSLWAFFFGTWFLIASDETTTLSWEWLSPATKGPAASVSLNEDSTWTVSWSMLPLPPLTQFAYEDLGEGQYQFIDQSLNEPESWLWDFGDGTSSTEQHPVHTYSAPGDYTVCLIATNFAGSDTACMDIEVVLPPVAAFTYTDDGAGTFTFTDQSLNEPESWLWDFGDSTSSTEQHPVHTYTASGDYTVCLVVSNAAGSDTTCQTLSVVVSSLTGAYAHLEMQLYPNPTSEVFTLAVDWDEELQFELCDLRGQRMRVVRFVQSAELSVADLPQGAYLYALRTMDGALVARGRILVLR